MYKEYGAVVFFGEDIRYEKLSKQGDHLERLNEVINWNAFESVLKKVKPRPKLVSSGQRPYDPILMF